MVHMPQEIQSAPEYDNEAGCLTRLYWMFIGNVLLFIAFAYLLDRHPPFPSVLDFICLLIVASLIIVRYADIRHFKGENARSTRISTMSDWNRYAALLGSGSAVTWLLIRWVIPLFWK